MLYDIRGKANLQRPCKDQRLPGVLGEGGMSGWDTEGVVDSENTLHDTLIIDPCHCALVQTQTMQQEQTLR